MTITEFDLINNVFNNVLTGDDENVYIFSREFGELSLDRRREIVQFQEDFIKILGYQFQEKGNLIFVRPPSKG